MAQAEKPTEKSMEKPAEGSTENVAQQPAEKPAMQQYAQKSIFNKRATERLRSPDDLDKYVRVTNPSVWVVLVACIALVAGLLAWGVFGAVTSSVTATGSVVDGKAMCFLKADDVAKVDRGEPANVGGVQMTVGDIAFVPLSRDEAGRLLSNDYLVNTLVQTDWVYSVEFEGDASSLAENVPISVNIMVERVAPISLVLGNQR